MELSNSNRFFIIGPTESVLTKRGNRFPNIAEYLNNKGDEVIYYTSDFYHAEKRFFKLKEIEEAKNTLGYELTVFKTLGYYNNVSVRRVLHNFFFSLQVFLKLLFGVNKNDIIFLPSRPVELIYFIALLKRLKGVKIYLDIQDIWPDALVTKSKKKKKIFETYCNAFLRPALKHYNNTIHVAPSFKNWLKRYSSYTTSVFIPLGWENKRWADFNKMTNPADKLKFKLVCVS